MKLSFDYNSQSFAIDLTPGGSGKSYRAMIGEKTVDVEIIRVDEEHGRLELLIDGERVTAYVSSENAKRWVTVNGRTVVLTKSSGAKRGGAGQDHASELAAPMPGVVRSVNVGEGESVTKGQTLMVLEAMKMEIRIQAPFDGVVKSLAVKVGQTVEGEQVLIVLER
jgi:acetyl/propionyl-CoA carboxylase alpha subunit